MQLKLRQAPCQSMLSMQGSTAASCAPASGSCQESLRTPHVLLPGMPSRQTDAAEAGVCSLHALHHAIGIVSS